MQYKTGPVQTAVPLNVRGLVMPAAAVLLLQACEREKRGREKKSHGHHLHLQVPLLSTAAPLKPFQAEADCQVRSAGDANTGSTSVLCMQFFILPSPS